MAAFATFYDHIRDMAREEGMSFAEALEEAKKLGISLLETSQNNLLGREDEVGRELARAGMGISSVPAYFDFGRNADVKGQSLPTLEAARHVGAQKLLVIPGFFRPEDGPGERERQTLAMAEGINRLAELAAPFGVGLVMEDYDSALAPYSRAWELRRFFDACPGLFCCFDTGNFRFQGEDLREAYGLLRDRIRHVHLKDRAYTPRFGEACLTAADGQGLYPCPVGSGDLPLDEVICRLREDGYDGVYTVEHFHAARQLEALQSSVRWLRAQLA